MNNRQNGLRTLVVGGSIKPERFSNVAIRKLVHYGYPVFSVGLREGEVAGVRIEKGKPDFENIDTVTLYVGPGGQADLYDYILGLNPRRIVFNPGTENGEFEMMAIEKGIQTVRNCTLIMLDLGEY